MQTIAYIIFIVVTICILILFLVLAFAFVPSKHRINYYRWKNVEKWDEYNNILKAQRKKIYQLKIKLLFLKIFEKMRWFKC